jgi:hypothetical protein
LLNSLFCDDDIVCSYSRAQAIADGVLVDVTEMAKKAGFKVPVAMTTEAWTDSVMWLTSDSDRQTHQDESARLWDVLWMLHRAIGMHGNCDSMVFEFFRVPRDGRSRRARAAQLKSMIGPGDDGLPAITIMLLGQD